MNTVDAKLFEGIKNTSVLFHGIQSVGSRGTKLESNNFPIINIVMSSIHISSEVIIENSMFAYGSEAISYSSILPGDLIPSCFNIFSNPGYVRICPVNHNLIVEKSSFIGNILFGSILLVKTVGSGSVTIDECEFINNTQKHNFPYQTWAEYYYDTFGVAQKGISLYLDSIGFEIILINSTFFNNLAEVGNGPALSAISSPQGMYAKLVTMINISFCQFISNQAGTLYLT